MTQKQRILHLLADSRRVSNAALNRICFRYGARIMELRRAGFEIVSERDKVKDGGLWWFRLVTPASQIDWEKMQPKPQILKQGSLF